MRALPIGVFDSGVGGLTVLAALRAQLPWENFLYLGDTARVPYGTKSDESVQRYALQAVQLLAGRGVKAVVVACNTASAAALPLLRRRFPALPLVGVVEPGARAAVAASRNGHIAVVATEGTVRGGAYQRAIRALAPTARVDAVAAGLFVALAEEGWLDGPIAQAAAQRYLAPLFADAADAPDTLVLGCTHFPLLRGVIGTVAGPRVRIVDSAATTATALHGLLLARNLAVAASPQAAPSMRFLVTDDSARFLRAAALFLGEAPDAARVEQVDLQAGSA